LGKPDQIIVQSFVSCKVTANFRDENGKAVLSGGGYKTVTVPAKTESPKNILVLKASDFEAVKADLQPYLDLGQRGGMVLIENIPSGFWDPAARVAAAEAAKASAEGALSGAQAELSVKDARIEELKKLLDGFGWKGDGK
jgi:hypothetical protein